MYSRKFTTTYFYVINENKNSILSYATTVELGILPAIGSVVQKTNNTDIPAVSDSFQSIRKIKGRTNKISR